MLPIKSTKRHNIYRNPGNVLLCFWYHQESTIAQKPPQARNQFE